jgi:hypothetical protein
MSIQDCRAVYGLSGVGTNTRTNVSGSATIGISQTSMSFPDANEGYSVRMIFADAADEATLNPYDGDTTGTDSFTAGAAQVESVTITAAGGATSNGNLALVLTAAGLTGSPLTVNVPLTTTAHTTAALIATACRETLAANTAVAAMFIIGGTSAAVTLTRKPSASFTVPDGTLDLYHANDGTLELVVSTALGVTGATSSNTTAGVASAGVKLYDNGVNFEGKPITTMAKINGVLIKCILGELEYGDGGAYRGDIDGGCVRVYGNASELPPASDIVFTATTKSDITITVFGQTA